MKPSAVSKPDWPANDRRRALRYPCSCVAEVKRVGTEFSMATKVSDISRHGCYLETMSPFPVGTELLLTINPGKSHIAALALTRTSHPAMGNGVEFIKVELESAQRLEDFIMSLTASNSTSVLQKEPSPVSDERIDTSIELRFQALVDLLKQKSILNEDELSEQIRKISERARQS
ncbi:MAG: PilZ domain-containing protein [Candidatus Korobacteraceae bacterium]